MGNKDYIRPKKLEKWKKELTQEIYNEQPRVYMNETMSKIPDEAVFNFQTEFNRYCEQDAEVLREGCLKFRTMFQELCNIDPFQYFTLAQMCIAEYRAHHLPENTIGIHVNNGSDQYSAGCIKWLMSLSDAKDIYHAMNGGEKTIDGYKVDGYNPKTDTIYQYHGCYWHGCPKCYEGQILINITESL